MKIDKNTTSNFKDEISIHWIGSELCIDLKNRLFSTNKLNIQLIDLRSQHR